jgi:RNA-binding protein Musashi
MREFFSQFGKVVDSTVMLDRETGRSKGFGFVSFEDTDVTPFLGFGNLEIDGKLVGFTIILESRLLFSPTALDRCQARSASLST